MATNDIYKLIDRAYNNDQVNLNVYHFRADNAVATNMDARGLAEAYAAQNLPFVCAIQNNTLIHTAIEVENLFDPADRFTLLVTEAGNISVVDEAPIFLAVSVGLEHTNGEVRQGRKAYGGLDENEMSNGTVSGSPILTGLADLMDALVEPMLNGLVDSWFPIVLSSLLADGSYGVPTTLSQAVFGEITGATYNPLVSTQNTRKTGRGA